MLPSTEASEPSLVDVRRTPAATLAAVILVAIGGLIALPGLLLVLVFADSDCALGSSCLDMRGVAVFGAGIAAIGGAHIAAGTGMWRLRSWGRLLGGFVAIMGVTWTTLMLVSTAAPLPGIAALAYLVCLYGTWRWTDIQQALADEHGSSGPGEPR